MKIDQKLWKTDRNRRKFLLKSKHELKNSAKRFKKRKESIQIRITKEAHKLIKEYARKTDKSILSAGSEIIVGVLEANDELLLDYVLTV